MAGHRRSYEEDALWAERHALSAATDERLLLDMNLEEDSVKRLARWGFSRAANALEALERIEIVRAAQPGQQFYWRYQVRGGYGREVYVPCTVVKVTAKAVRVAAQKKDGTTEERNVMPESLFTKEQVDALMVRRVL